MRYQGGKCRIAKPIMTEILKYRTDEDTFVDLFVGGGAVAIEATKHFDKVLANDKHPYIIALLQGVKDGWVPPETLTREEHESLKTNPKQDPKLAGFAGFGCSFGGMWFHTYGLSSSGAPLAPSVRRALLRDQPAYAKMEFSNLDYKDLDIPENAIIYADPPYASTHPYAFTGTWDVAKFWDYMRELSKAHKVFISEQTAPDDFVSVWSKSKRRSMCNNNKTQPVVMEHLFVWKEGKIL